MRPISPDELVPLEAFEAVRPALREAVIAHKKHRRVSVGERVTLLFEDRETLRWQVLEMCRVERIRDPAAVQNELDVYNQLVPGEHELSATLFIEITDSSDIRSELDRLIGLDEHVSLSIGADRIPARFDAKQMEEDRIAAVQYIRFPLDAPQAERFRRGEEPVSLHVDHPHYSRSERLSDEVRRSLAVDLFGEPVPLFVPLAVVPPAEEEVLIERGRVRAVVPARPLARGHRVVEPLDASVSFADVDPALLAEALELARELARELTERFGSCRISWDAVATPLRIDVFSPE